MVQGVVFDLFFIDYCKILLFLIIISLQDPIWRPSGKKNWTGKNYIEMSDF